MEGVEECCVTYKYDESNVIFVHKLLNAAVIYEAMVTGITGAMFSTAVARTTTCPSQT